MFRYVESHVGGMEGWGVAQVREGGRNLFDNRQWCGGGDVDGASAKTLAKINFNSRSRTSLTDDSSSDHYLVAAAAQPEADVFCGCQEQV